MLSWAMAINIKVLHDRSIGFQAIQCKMRQKAAHPADVGASAGWAAFVWNGSFRLSPFGQCPVELFRIDGLGEVVIDLGSCFCSRSKTAVTSERMTRMIPLFWSNHR